MFTFLIKETLLITLLFLIPQPGPLATSDPWEPRAHEIILTGTYQGLEDDLLCFKTEEALGKYPYIPEIAVGLIGPHSGKLIPLSQFPVAKPAQIIMTPNGTVRALFNRLTSLACLPGTTLKQGLLASLSPTEKHYTLFNLEQGLSLHNLTTEAEAIFLTNDLPSAWNSSGTQIAFVQENSLVLYEITRQLKKTYPLPSPQEGLSRVIFSLAWSPLDDKLLFTFLEEEAQQSSALLQVMIMDQQGQFLGSTFWENPGPFCWLSNEEILLISNPGPLEKGEIIIWNCQTGEKKTLQTNLNGFCHNLCLHPTNSFLAFTFYLPENQQENLYLYKPTQSQLTKIKSSIFPLTNLQWGPQNTLVYGDEINNTIIMINDSGEEIAEFGGFLPPQAVQERLLYFPEKPQEKPLPLFLSPHLL